MSKWRHPYVALIVLPLFVMTLLFTVYMYSLFHTHEIVKPIQWLFDGSMLHVKLDGTAADFFAVITNIAKVFIWLFAIFWGSGIIFYGFRPMKETQRVGHTA
ncbi:hypothetical protein [Brevibacillus dissolubilis]|uniref:hypothetical protein n=1 Tax=Brevibacillus dissolubilis TaxID=1844116 RepID=UPI0011171639|nr:hypothetical protein [Brevibacillus dissolubilis]